MFAGKSEACNGFFALLCGGSHTLAQKDRAQGSRGLSFKTHTLGGHEGGMWVIGLAGVHQTHRVLFSEVASSRDLPGACEVASCAKKGALAHSSAATLALDISLFQASIHSPGTTQGSEQWRTSAGKGPICCFMMLPGSRRSSR